MSVVVITPRVIVPTPLGVEVFRDLLELPELPLIDKLFRRSSREQMVLMAGSDANDLSKKLADVAFGATAYTAVTPIYLGLWTAALDDTFTGATASEAAYTSYGRMSLTNNTTIFAAGSGTTTYTKTWPSDAAKSWATSTGGAATVTYMGALTGNAGTSADKGMVWASVTSVAIASGDTPQLAQNALSQVRD